ncbi:MAG: hypothetical protein WC262_09805 [Bacteroidales bacterium]
MVSIDPAYNPFPVTWSTKVTNPTIDPMQLIQLIESEGVMARWEMASRCPCSANTSRDNPISDCPVCGGRGFIFHHAQDTKILIQQIGADVRWIEKPRTLEEGEVIVSARAEHCPTKYDRITLTNCRMRISAIMRRKAARAVLAGDTAYEPLNVPIIPQTITYRDSNNVNTQYSVGVTYVRGQDADSQYPGPELVEGVDFTVDYDSTTGEGRLNWAIGDLKNDGLGHSTSVTPGLDGMFTVSYVTRPIYRVSEWTHTIRDTSNYFKSAPGTHHAMPVQFKAMLETDLRLDVGA